MLTALLRRMFGGGSELPPDIPGMGTAKIAAAPSGGTYTITQNGRSVTIPYDAPPEWPGKTENVSIPDLDNRFRYHPPQTEQRRAAHESVRDGLLVVAKHFDVLLPAGREKSLAMAKLEEAMFWANASLARHSDSEMEADTS
jgi:hypothetical protein